MDLGVMMRYLFTLFILLSATHAFADAPAEVKEFFVKSVPAGCAYTYLGPCNNGYCYGEQEVFMFGIRGAVPQSPEGHSFKDYSSDGETFRTQYAVTETQNLETLTLSLYREAWAPTFPIGDGRNVGVSKFDYIITKRASDGKIVFVQETELIRKRNIFGSLSKHWEANGAPRVCKED